MNNKPTRIRNGRCFTISYFYCNDCGCKMTVPRMKNHEREKGHKKDIWCPVCKKIQTMEENRYCDHNKNALGEFLI